MTFSHGEAWNDDERIKANNRCRLLHRGQSIDTDCTVTGDLPPTGTLGFRWSAVNNMFNTPGELRAEEWQATRSPDEENVERAMRQFVWCLPVLPTKFDDLAIETHELTTRISPFARGIVPEGTQYLKAVIDLLDRDRMNGPTFDHEKLDVYRLSIDYAAFSYRIAKSLNGRERYARDQWLRAAQSIPLNIADRNGKPILKDKNRFLEIARGSALECATSHDILTSLTRHSMVMPIGLIILR